MDEVEAGLRAGTILLVDVREPHEFENGAIPGSVSHPLSRFDPASLPAANERRLVFSCAADVRSKVAIGMCQAAGLDLHEHYLGGFAEWVRSGRPVTFTAV